jgi:hypothetical protein
MLAFGGAAMWTDFRVPEHIRTHCREQTIHLDDRGLIARHDYVAEAFGPWAHGVHRSSDFRVFDGLPVPTRRRVRFRRFGPVIVKLDVSEAAGFSEGVDPGHSRS